MKKVFWFEEGLPCSFSIHLFKGIWFVVLNKVTSQLKMMSLVFWRETSDLNYFQCYENVLCNFIVMCTRLKCWTFPERKCFYHFKNDYLLNWHFSSPSFGRIFPFVFVIQFNSFFDLFQFFCFYFLSCSYRTNNKYPKLNNRISYFLAMPNQPLFVTKVSW